MAKLFQPFQGIEARTNMLNILDDKYLVIENLLNESGNIGNVTYSYIEIEKKKNESSADYYKRVDFEIKTAIRFKLKLKDSEPVRYSKVKKRFSFIYFFISPYKCSSLKLIGDIKKNGFNTPSIIEKILSLRFNLSYLDEISMNYELSIELYNSDLYIAPVVIKTEEDGKSLIDTLRVNIFYSNDNEIAVSLHKKVFKCVADETFTPKTNNSDLLLHHKNNRLKIEETANATKFSDRFYMEFDLSKEAKKKKDSGNKGYSNCINYHLTITIDKIKNILTNSNISYDEVTFKAEYIYDDFIKSKELSENKLIIIDNFENYENDIWKNKYRNYLQLTFNADEIIGIDDAPQPDNLNDKEISYLVVNESKKKNGSSITRLTDGKIINSTIEATHLHSTKGDTFDYYTSVKINRFLNRINSVTQGLDIKKITKETSKKDEKGNKIPGEIVLDEINKNKINKIKTELWLKERVFHHENIYDLPINDASLILFFCRNTEDNKYISVVDVEVKDRLLTIISHKTHELDGVFDKKYASISNIFTNGDFFKSMENGYFYIYDRCDKLLLTSYSSSRIPMVIGNASIDNIEKNSSGIISRHNSPEICVLPYYINKKDKNYHHVYLQDKQAEGLFYFVSKSGPTASNFKSQIRTQNILVYNQDGEKQVVIDKEITKIFFQSFTYDMFNIKNISRKSLFQKIAELYIEN